MLRLERMEVSGFKSFPDKTVVDFPGGVTAVVGPNGCGKSNIADAIQWVLGEQSARALRGAKMEDVIFNGSQNRGPGGLAEVSVQLVARADTLAFGRSRVTLTRRLFRSGESEYLIDGKKARLADVRDLLDEVRAGVRTYAIIDQAQVASFVTSKPKERRVFIEEAAGTAGYRNRRRLAELKLEATRSNLLRVDDILREVERQRRSLQRQASLARRARRLDEELRALRTYWFATRGRELTRHVRDLTEELAVARREAEHLDRERARRAQRLSELRLRLEEAHGGRTAALEALHKARLDEERLAREIDAALARAEGLAEAANRQEGEDQRVEEDRERRVREAAEQERLVAEADARLAELDASLQAARAAAEAGRRALQQGQDDAHRLERSLYDRLHQRADLAARLSAAREASAREEKRAEEAAAAGARLEQSKADAQAAVAAAEENARRAGEESDRLVAEVQHARQAEESGSTALEQARIEDARLASALGQVAGEKAALDALSVRLAGADAARAVLESARAGKLRARSVVADLLAVDQELERAAEAFLADTLPAVVVDSLDEVLRGAQLGVKGRVRLLALDAAEGQRGTRAYDDLPLELHSDPRVRGRLRAHVGVGGDERDVVAARLPDAILVDTLETALELHRRHPDWNYLTPEGHAVDVGGVVSLEGRGDAQKDGLLARVRRREQLAREVAELEAKRTASHARLEQARADLQNAQLARRQAEEKLADARRGVATARMAFEQAGREQQRIERELALAGTVREAAERGRDEARARAASLETQVRDAEHAAEEARAALEQAREAVRGREEAAREAASVVAGLSSDRGAHAERRAAAARDLERLRREIADLAARSLRGTEARQRALDEAAALRARADEARADLERVQARRAQAAADEQRWSEALEQRGAEVRGAEERVGAITEELEGARARRERLALDAERGQADLEHLLADCRAELNDEPENLPIVRPEGFEGVDELLQDEAALAARIADLRERRERVGPVNLLAEQEFEELSVRFEELSKQHGDLSQTIDELTGSIKKMDRESRERFLEAFAEIRRHFREQFAGLFRGGRGDLVLDDEDNPLECGIEILCQPPGKKLQTVSLLSGGEKALAATAVLFSIFRFQPPPFCLLDEVDAPLDDANVGRFADSIRGFTAGTQFILVTHNKRTMEMADILYGVTMPEPGVSRIVSMTLD